MPSIFGDVSHKNVRMYKYPTKVFTRKALPSWAIKCCEIMVEQLNARFLQRKMNKWVYIATVLDPRIKLDKCFTAGDAMNATEVKALYMTELNNVARHHAPLMLVRPDPPPGAHAAPRPATSTNNRGYLDLFDDSSDDEDEPIAHQVRAQQQRSDTRSLAVMESDRFFDLREKQGRIYRKDKSFTVMAFFDKNKEDLFLHRLLDTRTRSAKVDEASCERDFSLSGRVLGSLRESMATGVGEQLVSIPLMAQANPVTVDQVRRQYMANNARLKNQKAKAAGVAQHDDDDDDDDDDNDDNDDDDDDDDNDDDNDDGNDSNVSYDSSKSGYDSQESAAETQWRLGRGKRRTPRTSETHSRKTRLQRHRSG